MKQNNMIIKIGLITGAIIFRIFLKLQFIEPSGLYVVGFSPVLFWIYIAGVCFYFLYDGFKSTTQEVIKSFLYVKKKIVRSPKVSLIICALLIFLQSGITLMRIPNNTGFRIFSGIEAVLGIAAAVVLGMLGVSKVRNEYGFNRSLEAIAVIPSLWALARLVEFFMINPQIYGLSDLTLEFLFWMSLSMFLLSWGKVLGNYKRTMGMRSILAYGWIACCLGLTGVVPQLVLGQWSGTVFHKLLIIALSLLGMFYAASYQFAYTVKPVSSIEED